MYETADQQEGRRCGAALIDQNFLEKFLPRRLSREDIDTLRFSGGYGDHVGGAAHKSLRRGEEDLLEQFIGLKHSFKGLLDNGREPEPSWVNLPQGVGTLDEGKLIKHGLLGISWYEARPELSNMQFTDILQSRYDDDVQRFPRGSQGPDRGPGPSA